MTCEFNGKRLIVAILGCGLSTLAVGVAWSASPWHGDERSAVRLIAGAPKDGDAEVLRAGLEIRLQPGWKTYWRYPGDSGIPPRFAFEGSENVAQVSVLWPAPQRFDDGAGGSSIGYGRGVILPLHVVPREPGKPVTLRLALDYAICEKLCIPVEAKTSLALPRGPTGFDGALAAAEGRVPKPVPLGPRDPLGILSMQLDAADARRVLVDVAAPAGARVALFAEGPTPEWALPLPAPVAGAPAGSQRFAFELDGLPPGAPARGAVLRLTAVAGDGAVEATAPLP